MERLLQRMSNARDLARKAGPYLLVEIVLPGGTLIALTMFLIQRHWPSLRASALRGWFALGTTRKAHGETLRGGLEPYALLGSLLRRARAFATWIAREWAAVVGAAGLQAPRARDGLEPLGFHPG